ncbi:hypothetical protein PspLS_09595 [Pyricularia sp. CBS 133598]|nr:hypothetical protein PspLS_09595 [Pyricularia sp. CBS 133598]
MILLCDEDKPVSSIDRYYAQHEASGEEGCDIIYVPPHWHKASRPLVNHGEYHEVLVGQLEITVDSKVIILREGDPPLYVPPGAVHSIKSFPGERVVGQERADPPGAYKIEYFNDALSTGDFANNKAHLLRALYDGDGYISLPFGFKPLEQLENDQGQEYDEW